MIFSELFLVTAEVELFPQKGGWYYVSIPQNITKLTEEFADRGLVAIKANLGNSSWQTSLMPMGDGTQFIPLPKKVRQAEQISLGNSITISFQLRER